MQNGGSEQLGDMIANIVRWHNIGIMGKFVVFVADDKHPSFQFIQSALLKYNELAVAAEEIPKIKAEEARRAQTDKRLTIGYEAIAMLREMGYLPEGGF
jgi:hypothetical protein